MEVDKDTISVRSSGQMRSPSDQESSRLSARGSGSAAQRLGNGGAGSVAAARPAKPSNIIRILKREDVRMIEENKGQAKEDSIQKRNRTTIHSMSIHDENEQESMLVKSSQKQFKEAIEVIKKKQVGSQRETPTDSQQPPEDEKEGAGGADGNCYVQSIGDTFQVLKDPETDMQNVDSSDEENCSQNLPQT